MSVPKVGAQIELDAAMWERIDAAGEQRGLSRDQVIGEAVGRVLGGQALAALFERIRERSDLTVEDADALAAEERAQARDRRQ
jgi:hypothetical protein